MRAISFLITLLLTCSVHTANAQGSESGFLGVYPDYLHGRTTASGVRYDMGQLSAAHATLPLGSFARVANFDTGRMVDVKITDRKGRDDRIVTLSRAAAERIGLAPNAAAQGSLLLISGIKTPSPAVPMAAGAVGAVAAGSISQGVPQQRGFKPFSIFNKKDPVYDAVVNTAAPINPVPDGRAVANQQIAQTQSQVNQKTEGLFKNGLFGNRSPKNAQIKNYAPAGSAGYAYPEMKPLSSTARIPSPDIPPLAAPRPVAPAPIPAAQPSLYRVQFGAFRSHENAVEMARGLGGAGIATSVFKIQNRNLNAVLLNGGFRSEGEAQNWINTEAARRGWREKPVVVR